MLIVLVFFCLQHTSATMLEYLHSKSNIFTDYKIESTAECILSIAIKNSLYKSTTVILYDHDQRDVEQETLISSALRMLLQNSIPSLITDDLKSIDGITDIKFLILIFHKKCEMLFNSDYKLAQNKFYLIIIQHYSDQCFQIMSRYSQSIQTFDVTFLIYDLLKKKNILMTNTPEYDEKNCTISENVKLLQVNECNDGILSKINFRNIFPYKDPHDYKKCPFKIGLGSLFPYSTIPNYQKFTNLDPIDKAHGSDLEILKIVSQNINATLDLYFIKTDPDTEFLKFLINGTFDVCAGGLYRLYGNIIDYSGAYSSQTVDWVYYVERDVRSWQSLSAKINGLYYFLIFYIIYSLVWKVMLTFDHQAISIGQVLLYGWGALIGANSPPYATSLKQKVLNISYLVLSLHLSAYISGQMYAYLTIQGPPTIYKTADELRNSDRTPYLSSKKNFVHDRKFELFANSSKECSTFNDCLNAILKFKGTTLLLDSYLIPFQEATAVNDEVRILRVPESILVVYHEMLISKDHPLRLKYKCMIEKLFEAGICNKLYKDAIGATTVHKSEIFTKNLISNSYSCTVGCSITLGQLGGVFYVWAFGSILSILIFVLEIFIGRRMRKLH